ncbi:tripartite tricarboxylate transporter substrate binding protein [Acidovorax sp. SUPP950]|uniref:Bug family tripartite tricarboxylate transporter substrate binding protein n=1 Tax=unclassified Acidovorax TaxID=2684926 RepID=UPI00234ACD27|nr:MULTISPECIES: tripartite tricarboxylate transporter substrate binding protein [Comamonadaceae]WCM99179.1 tripartite tricarboxylate transporter substrate binding protein [Acidovorax sp. GBBC 1281]WOI47749.1 tripartite tricarboxylate transporter substrate binding protein [Paracidovorax avenae]GKS75871.1 tripartite tricarboxylate transporter substrate binding protein [Acidovorax sp. SUPP950]GKS90532.1 tripartite tricarboxylate transporter substrate binding protein [Acidovorax sp. SUPP2539]GKS9
MQRRPLIAAAFLAASFPLASTAQAQDFPPKKPVTLVVGFAAGGSADIAARIIAKKLGENIGQSVVVDNKPGAGGNLAHAQVANGPSDGSMLLFGSIGPLSIAPHFMKVAYDPLKDLAPISMGVAFPNVLVVPASTGIKSLGDFVAKAKREPGKLDYASTGPGSAAHLAGELLNDVAKIDTLHVPYKGGAPALQDVLGGRVTAFYAAPPSALPHIESGKLIPLATTGLTRPAYLPNVPTVAETYPGFNATNWYAFVASAKTPKPLLDRWNTEIVKVLNTPEVRDNLLKHGQTASPTGREELGQFIAAEHAKWGRIIRERKITAD